MMGMVWFDQPVQASFELHFLDRCPYELGENVGKHPVDGFGNSCSLPADGYVERIELDAPFDGPQLVKVTVGYTYYVPWPEEAL